MRNMRYICLIATNREMNVCVIVNDSDTFIYICLMRCDAMRCFAALTHTYLAVRSLYEERMAAD